jgi:hypothetical protein
MSGLMPRLARQLARTPEIGVGLVLVVAMLVIGSINPAFWDAATCSACCAPTSSPASWPSACWW